MKNLFLAIIASISLHIASAQTVIEDVTFTNTLNVNNQELVLNGGGVRVKFFMDMYVGALYLKAKSKEASTIMDSDEAMAIKLHIVSGLITSEKMSKATIEGFENATNNNTASIQEKIDRFIKIFSSEEIEKKDEYNFHYIPGTGTKILKNGVEKDVIKGLDFKKALFGIWLGNKPASKDLRLGMLGISNG